MFYYAVTGLFSAFWRKKKEAPKNVILVAPSRGSDLLAATVQNINMKLDELSTRTENNFKEIKKDISIIDKKILDLGEKMKNFDGENALLEVIDIN